MLGHRGCRLGITYPEIYDMQVEAIFEAMADLKEEGLSVETEIMVPLVGFRKELEILKARIHKAAEKVILDREVSFDYKVGTMIEVPRAALTADEIAKEAEFFSFGTNDLTQMTLGFSRDDSSKFIHHYKSKTVFDRDPFERIDETGVGQLMKLAKQLGRSSNDSLKLGICGEHGGEPNSIKFCHNIGLDYVSCSPYRVPIARLSAAQAAILSDEKC
jgi:pyruvate,orthophosphate dikinase